jgi:ribosomal protein L11 methyltransferase
MVSVLLHCDGEQRDLLIAELYERGTTGIVEHDGFIEAYFDTEDEAKWLGKEIRDHGTRDYVAEVQEQWQPVAVGERFWLAAPWDSRPEPEGKLRLEYQAGMACGSGVHPCTRLCIAALERCVCPGAAVLDVGVGSGILLMAARLLGAGVLTGCDIDHDAVVLAQHAVPDACLFTGSTASIRDGAFDVVVANISSGAAEDLHSELRRICRGTLIISGFRADDLPQGYGTEPVVMEEWAAISESSSARL